jgi:hypothetical protein
MAIPVLHLNLVPPPTVWRQNHEALGIAALFGGILALGLAGGFSIQKYIQASREGRRIVSISAEAQKVAREQARVVDALRQVDTAERLPRYRLAERIFLERSLPWSRLTTEMERNLVQDVRIRSLQRVRSSDGSVTMKIRGEARARAAEAGFIEALQGNGMFTQVVLEREAERAGGGIDFDVSLPVASAPPAFEPVPIPPVQVVDQFGKPLTANAKVVKTLSAGQTLVPAAKPVPAPTAPVPVKPEPQPPQSRPIPAPQPPFRGQGGAQGQGDMQGQVNQQGQESVRPSRAPGFNRGQEQQAPQRNDNSPDTPSPRRRPTRRGGNDGGAP